MARTQNAIMSLKNSECIDIPHIFHFDMQFRWPRHVQKNDVKTLSIYGVQHFCKKFTQAWDEKRKCQLSTTNSEISSWYVRLQLTEPRLQKHAWWCLRPKWLNCHRRWMQTRMVDKFACPLQCISMYARWLLLKVSTTLRGARSQTSNSWSFIYFTFTFH